jgi:hypothetical protein
LVYRRPSLAIASSKACSSNGFGQVRGGAGSSETLAGRGIVVALMKDGETRKAEVKVPTFEPAAGVLVGP